MKFCLLSRVALALFAVFFMVPRSDGQQPAPAAASAPIVRSIDVQYAGAARISKEKVMANMRTRVGRPYSESVVEEDIRNLYATGNVSNVRIFGEPAGAGGVKVIVVIAAKAQISEVLVSGPDKVKASRIRKEITAKPGDQLSEATLEQDRQKIIEFYANKGYGDVNVTYNSEVNEKAGTARVTFTVTEGGKTLVDDVLIQGNSQVKAGDIRKVVKTRPKSVLNPMTYFSKANRLNNEQLETDAAAVRELYQNRGYADVQVATPRVDRRGNNVDVTFTINEGPQYRVGRVSYSGAQVLTQDELTRGAKVRSGEIYSPANIRTDVKSIQDQYGSRGYIDFNAGAQTKRSAPGTMDVAFSMDEGVQSYVEKINISGNTRTKDKVLRREIALTPGEVYNTVRVDASRSRLNNLNYFSKVDMYPSDTMVPGRKDLNVLVEEKRTGSFNFGAGFSSIDSLLGFVEVTQGNFDILHWPNFTGGGQKFRIRAQYGTRRKDFIIALTEPYFMDRELSLGGELFYREASFVSAVYDEGRYGGTITARKRLGTFTSGRLGYRLENISIQNVDEGASQTIKNEEGDRLKSEISLGILYDSRDSVFLTRRGLRVDASAFVAGGFLGGNTDIYGFDIEASKWFLLPWDTILTLNGEIANVTTWADGDRVPIFDRLYLGGANNLRGFNFRDVGPKDEDGEPIGGSSLWRFTVEYTFPIVEKVRGAFFYDMGAVGTDSFAFNGDVNSDVGFGVRLDLPIGPVRIDYGIPVQADRFNDSSGRFQFNIGYQF